MGLLCRKSEHLVLPGPFGRQVAEAHNSYSMWKSSLDGSLDEVGREEGERDRHIDLADATLLSLRDAVRGCVSHELIEPAAINRSRLHHLP